MTVAAEPQIEQALERVTDERSFINELLIKTRDWEIDDAATKDGFEPISYKWSQDDLRAAGLDKKLVEGQIRQIQPMAGNPWGIFLLEFNQPNVFTDGRGMTGTMRQVLRGLVPSK